MKIFGKRKGIELLRCLADIEACMASERTLVLLGEALRNGRNNDKERMQIIHSLIYQLTAY